MGISNKTFLEVQVAIEMTFFILFVVSSLIPRLNKIHVGYKDLASQSVYSPSNLIKLLPAYSAESRQINPTYECWLKWVFLDHDEGR